MFDSPVQRYCIAAVAAASAIFGCWGAGVGAESKKRQRALPRDLVYLADVTEGVYEDIRYATRRNFTGAALPGYDRGACVLRRRAAEALGRVQADLARRTPPLALKVFDCYRPRRAVQAMVRWSRKPADPARQAFYFPNVAKSQLFARQYISPRSTHARGTTVDLTLVRQRPATDASGAQRPRRPRSCIDGGSDGRGPVALDMGTTFDCFDIKSHTRSRSISPAQSRNREILVNAMARHGFANYRREWWHFTYRGVTSRRTFDLPIR